MDNGLERYWTSRDPRHAELHANGKVLLLTEDLFQEFLYRSILEDLGYAVDVVATFETGKLNYSTIQYELILLDLDSCRSAGLAMVRYLAESKQKSEVPLYIHVGPDLVKEEKDILRLYSPLEFITHDRLLLCELFNRGTGRDAKRV